MLSSVTSIGDNVFYECLSLSEIVIHSSVTQIGKNVFSGIKLKIVYENRKRKD